VWLPKREYGEYNLTGEGQDLSGMTLPRAPEWSVIASLVYRRPLAHGELTGRVEFSYRSGFVFTYDQMPNPGDRSQDPYGLLNLYLRYDPSEANWYAFAAGRNLTGEDYFHQVYIQSLPGYPDTWEVGAGIRF
jgi:iron complex outermembrane receptor protein